MGNGEGVRHRIQNSRFILDLSTRAWARMRGTPAVTSSGHVTSVMPPIDSSWALSYRFPIVNSPHRRRSSVNFRGARHFCPKNMCEKITKWPNFT